MEKEKTVKSFDFTVFLFAANKWKPGRGVPFFYAGYYLTKEHVEIFRNAKWKWIFPFCAAILTVIFVI